ncbi:multidrug effflux MFS transporter [Rheinheimera sp.]|uniref:multidrug effflux MFS transporter n=1 Tax=Rheinheimera sp. TaxID=1869214 RepID=UPI003D2BEC03
MANRPSLALIALFASVVAVTPLAIDMYLPAMPLLSQALQTDAGAVQQSLSIFLAFYAIGMLLFGPLADAIGRRTLVLFGLTGFVASSIWLSQCTSIESFLVARALQAFFGSAATVVVPGMIRQLYQEHTAKGMSYVSMMMMLAPLLAPAIGSGVLSIADWRWIFLTLAGYGLLILLCSWRFFPPTHPDSKRKPEFFSAYRTVLSRNMAQPLIAVSMFASFSFFCFLTAVPFIYIGHFHVDTTTFSVLFGCNVLALIAANFANARLVVKHGSARLLHIAFTSAGIWALLLTLLGIIDAPLWAVVTAIIPLMASLGICATNADALILMEFPEHSGTATAVIGTLRFGAGAAAGPLLALGGQTSVLPFAVLMLSGVCGMGLALWFRRVRGAMRTA